MWLNLFILIKIYDERLKVFFNVFYNFVYY